MKQKPITKTYRNGASVYVLPCIIALKTNVAGTEHYVTEQRVGFKDEKIIFRSKVEKEATEFYTGVSSTTLIGKLKSYLA